MKREFSDNYFKKEITKLLLDGINEPDVDPEWNYFKTRFNTNKKKYKFFYFLISVTLILLYVELSHFYSNTLLNHLNISIIKISTFSKKKIKSIDSIELSSKKLTSCQRLSPLMLWTNLKHDKEIETIETKVSELDSSVTNIIEFNNFLYEFEQLKNSKTLSFKLIQTGKINFQTLESRFFINTEGFNKLIKPQIDFGLLLKRKMKKNSVLFGFNYSQLPINYINSIEISKFYDSTRLNMTIDSTIKKSFGVKELVLPIGYSCKVSKNLEFEFQYRFSVISKLQQREERYKGTSSLLSPSSIDSLKWLSTKISSKKFTNFSCMFSIIYERKRYKLGVSYIKSFSNLNYPRNHIKIMIGINLIKSRSFKLKKLQL